MKPKILFIGRLEKDLGLETYFQALDILKLKIDFAGDGSLRSQAQKYGKVLGFVDIKKIINNYNIVFASSYLSILEALVNKKPVFAVYDNPLKGDYLKMSPFKDFIWIGNNPKKLAEELKRETRTINGYEWAKKQTWKKVTEIYLKLWKKYL